jgi:hypothetical protein
LRFNILNFLTILEFSCKWVKVMLPYRKGEDCLYGGAGGSLMTHSAGSVTNQSTAFKYVMASEPYRYTRYLKQVMTSLPYVKIYFFKNTYSIESKMVLNLI